MASITKERVLEIARQCGFELAGIAAAAPAEDYTRFEAWRGAGFAGEMAYLTDQRGGMRSDPRVLLACAKTVLCVGKLYNTDRPYSTDADLSGRGWISRYAWGEDYHTVVRRQLEKVVEQLRSAAGEPFEARVCVDTAPLLERTYARLAGLGWIGKNTCLINQGKGSWFFLGEVLLSLELEPDAPPPDRCGTCTRCIDACPTAAIVPDGADGYTLDARRCISYWTIEKRGAFTEVEQSGIGAHVFGCDICQDVCPWNREAPVTDEAAFEARAFAPELETLAAMTEEEFRERFRDSPVRRAKYAGFERNVAAARANDRTRGPEG
jgi:epoxyqueuosine reductase